MNSEWRIKEFEGDLSIVDVSFHTAKGHLGSDSNNVFHVAKFVLILVAAHLADNCLVDVQELDLGVLIVIVRLHPDEANLYVFLEIAHLGIQFVVSKLSGILAVFFSENEFHVRYFSRLLIFIPMHLSEFDVKKLIDGEFLQVVVPEIVVGLDKHALFISNILEFEFLCSGDGMFSALDRTLKSRIIKFDVLKLFIESSGALRQSTPEKVVGHLDLVDLSAQLDDKRLVHIM